MLRPAVLVYSKSELIMAVSGAHDPKTGELISFAAIKAHGMIQEEHGQCIW